MSEVFCANGEEGRVSEVFFFLEMVWTNLGKCGWVWEEKLRWLNPRWLNWRWLPSSSLVRMKEFESDWISLSQSFVQNGWIQDGRIQDGCHHQVNQIEWVKYFVQMVKREEGVKFFFLEMVWTNLGKCGWVWEEKLRWLNSRWPNWRWLPSSSWVRMNKWSILCKMVESKMAEFKMATIIQLSQNEWVKFFLCKMVERKIAEFKVAPSSS